jgi:hypothetical protein
VTKPTTHALLGEIHSILGRYQMRDFLDASNYRAVTHNIRVALRSLAKELDSAQRTSSGDIHSAKTSTRDNNQDWRETSSNVLAVLKQSPFFESNSALIEFAKELGFRLQAKPKESRERLSRRLAAYIETLPELQRERVFSDLLASRNSQTHGWVNVIKGSR